MKILITGGSGFIGTNLATDLIKKGHKVAIYDKRKSETYPALCILGDVRDRETLTSSMIGIDVVYHLAAEHQDNIQPKSLYYEVNVGGAENLVYALKKKKIKKLIYTSTVAVYGLKIREPNENSPIKPFNDYGWSKYKAEIIFNNWVDSDKTNALITVRPTVIFGKKNRGNVYNLLNQIAADRFIMVGNGKNKKSMGYVRNLTYFLTLLLNSEHRKCVYNYADKPDLSINDLLKISRKALGKNTKVNFRIPYIVGLMGGFGFDILAKITGKAYPVSSIRIKKFSMNSVINADKIKETGFNAPYNLQEGLKQMIESEFV